MFDNGNVNWCMLGRAFLCRTGHFCVEPGFFVSNHAFLCRTGLFLCRTSVMMDRVITAPDCNCTLSLHVTLLNLVLVLWKLRNIEINSFFNQFINVRYWPIRVTFLFIHLLVCMCFFFTLQSIAVSYQTLELWCDDALPCTFLKEMILHTKQS